MYKKYILFVVLTPFVLKATVNWDTVLDVSSRYDEAVSYTEQDILISGSGFVIFDNSLTLNDSYLRIDGHLDCRSNITLNNSIIEVYGGFDIAAGVEIVENGASSIIVTGNEISAGNIQFKGTLYDKITVDCDYDPLTNTDFLIIDPNSGSESIIQNIAFYGGYTSILIIDKRLETPINNCFFFGQDYGIWQEGVNELTDIRFCLFVDTFTAIGLFIEPTTPQTAQVAVDNVIIDNPNVSNSYGCVISGSQSQTNFGLARITNSIITDTYCGWYVDVNTYVGISFENVAYYENQYNDNLADSSPWQENPMYLSQSPFYTPPGPQFWQYFLNPDSPVADIELDYNLLQVCPEQLQTTLFSEPKTRNKGIGVGVPLSVDYSSKVYALATDLNLDGIVNNPDFAIFATQWGADSNSIADFNDSNSVDTLDLVHFCDSWLSDGSIRLSIVDDTQTLTAIYQEPNGLEDCLFAFFLNGEYLTTRDADNPILTINKSNYPNGEYYLRAIVVGEDQTGITQHYATESYTSVFQTPLSSFMVAEIFDRTKGLPISGKLADGYEIELKVIADEQILWTETFDGSFNAFVDPNCLNANSVSYEISYTYQPDMVLSILDLLPLELQESLLAANQTSGQKNALSLGGAPDFSTAGLIICMLADGMTQGVGLQDTGTARYAERMFRQKGVKTILLKGFGDNGQVTQKTLEKVFKKYPKINYAHIYAHGNYRMFAPWFLGRVQRTGLKFNDGVWPAYNSRHWTKKGQSVPQDYEWLRGKYEKGPSLEDLSFAPGQLKILVLESCYGLRNVATRRPDELIEYIQGAYEDELRWKLPYHTNYPFTDICCALEISDNTQVALGSAGAIIKGSVFPSYKMFFNSVWDKLSRNGSVLDSIAEGLDTAEHNNEIVLQHRIRGQGMISNIYLRSNIQ